MNDDSINDTDQNLVELQEPQQFNDMNPREAHRQSTVLQLFDN